MLDPACAGGVLGSVTGSCLRGPHASCACRASWATAYKLLSSCTAAQDDILYICMDGCTYMYVRMLYVCVCVLHTHDAVIHMSLQGHAGRQVCY